MIDREEFPRDKVCGDALIHDAQAALKQINLHDKVRSVAHTLDALRVFSPSRVDFSIPGTILSLKRRTLDALVAREAVDAGVTFARATATDIAGGDGRVVVSVKGLAESLRSGYCVLATGTSVGMARRLGMVESATPSAMAIRCYVRSPLRMNNLVVSYDRVLTPGFAWIVPLGDGLYNIGCGVTLDGDHDAAKSLKPKLTSFMQDFPLVREIMAGGEQVTPFKGAAIRTGLTDCRTPVHGRVVGVGEVIGTTFPFTSEGVGKAIHTGQIAADLIDSALEQDNPALLAGFRQRLDKEVRPAYEGYRVAQSWLSRPRLNDFMARRIRRSRYLQERVEKLLAGTGDPRAVYGPLSIARSLLGS